MGARIKIKSGGEKVEIELGANEDTNGIIGFSEEDGLEQVIFPRMKEAPNERRNSQGCNRRGTVGKSMPGMSNQTLTGQDNSRNGSRFRPRSSRNLSGKTFLYQTLRQTLLLFEGLRQDVQRGYFDEILVENGSELRSICDSLRLAIDETTRNISKEIEKKDFDAI